MGLCGTGSWRPIGTGDFRNEYGELCGYDSRDGRLYQLWHGGDDDGEEIEAWGITSGSYGRAPETLDMFRYFSGDIEARGGEVDVSVIVDRGSMEWTRGIRVAANPDFFARLANGPVTGQYQGGVQLGNIQLPDQDDGTTDMQPIAGHKGRCVAVRFRFRGKNQQGVIRELSVHAVPGGGRWGPEMNTGRASGGLTRIRWRRFDSVNLQDDPLELGSNVLTAGFNLDFTEHGAVKQRPGRRNLIYDKTALNQNRDGIPK